MNTAPVADEESMRHAPDGDATPARADHDDADEGHGLDDGHEGIELTTSAMAAGYPGGAARKRTFMDRVDAYISRLSTRNNFWHRVCSLIWLPYAFRSGIRMKRVDDKTFSAVLPFNRFNRNWYNAMAGAALLGNSEIAGGMYVFGICGGEYTVVCRNLEYRFLRPCFGPALYRITPREDIHALLASGKEFNVTIDMDVVQQIPSRAKRERRVGRCSAQFHVTPKAHAQARGRSVRP